MQMTKAIYVTFSLTLISLVFSCSPPCATEIVSHNGQVYESFAVNSTAHVIFKWKSDTTVLKSFSNLKTEVESVGQELIFATNGGMFTPSFHPVGWYVENGVEINSLRLDSAYGNFYLKPNGVFGIRQNGSSFIEVTDQAMVQWDDVKYATQSGPMLVIKGEIHKAFNKESTSTYIRSGVGIDSKGNIVFAISNAPTNFYNFATLFRDKLDCKNALYLDGAISKMYNKATERNEDGIFGVLIGVIE